MKCRQEFSSRGAELDLVRCFEMLGLAREFVWVPFQQEE